MKIRQICMLVLLCLGVIPAGIIPFIAILISALPW